MVTQKKMKKIISCFFVVASLINTSSLLAQPAKVVNYFGITPDQKYGLPNIDLTEAHRLFFSIQEE